ncbi:MAG: hypothetical protein HY482_02670 [Candidatus Wildermuthbacteria bacterium]|nr:hypothetical protein [Candidatus Wildermuthbacteria bacterium]
MTLFIIILIIIGVAAATWYLAKGRKHENLPVAYTSHLPQHSQSRPATPEERPVPPLAQESQSATPPPPPFRPNPPQPPQNPPSSAI